MSCLCICGLMHNSLAVDLLHFCFEIDLYTRADGSRYMASGHAYGVCVYARSHRSIAVDTWL